MGKVISTVLASGRAAKGLESSELESNSNLIVGLSHRSRPSFVVAAKSIFFFLSKGIRKSEVQPAPSIRNSVDPIILCVQGDYCN